MAEPGPAPSDSPAAAPQARGLSKQSVSPEVLYERYRGEQGMVLHRFLKLFRDAVLFDNSWTFGQAVTVFFDHAVDDETAEVGAERRLSFHMFRSCLRRFIRQSTMVTHSARAMLEKVGGTPGKDPSEDEYWRWEAFKTIVGSRLLGSPRSDDDALLNKFILQEPLQLLCLQNEYHLRRVYKALIKSKEPTAKSWESLCNPEQPLLMKKDSISKCLRELIPKEVGTLRSDDLNSAIRNGNHENTSREDTKDVSSGAVTFPEFMEMTVRCALGTTPFSSAPQSLDEGDGEEEAEGAEQADKDEPQDARSFSIENDTVEFAQQRMRKVWGWLFDWLEAHLEEKNDPALDHEVLMEDCPYFDEVYSDVQMLFAHYASGEPYSRTLDCTNPDLRLCVTDLLRMCRDAGILDSRVTLTAIDSNFKQLTGCGLGADVELDFFQWQTLMVALANLKYKEVRAQAAIRILLRKWLVPMVYVHVPRTDLSDFVFTSRIVSLGLTYESNLSKMLELFSTTKEITIGPDGEPEAEHEIEDEFKAKGLAKTAGDDSTDQNQTFLKDLKAKEAALGGRTKMTVKLSTMVDVVSFLKFMGLLPKVLSIEEVPEIFSAVINASPVHKVEIYQASVSVSQVFIILVQCALVGFARAPYATKYATREEKVLAALERLEVAYLGLMGKCIPLTMRQDFPSATLQVHGLTSESQLRDFLLTRRLERGMALVPVSLSSRFEDAQEEFEELNAARHGHRAFRAVPEQEDGMRPTSLGVPWLIREQLFAPPAPHPVGPLMETALMHHNAARYKAAVETYLQALNTWSAIMAEESVAGGGGGADDSLAAEAEGKAPAQQSESAVVDQGLLLYFYVALGGVYESAGLEELALACFCEGKIVGDKLPSSAPECALSYAAIGGIFFHLEQYQVALNFFDKALMIREETVGEMHMDTALLYNNLGCCYDMLNRVTEAVESFQKAKDVFSYEYGLTHPRTSSVLRNLSRIRQRRLDFSVKFDARKPTPCPAVLAGGKDKKKKGKKGGKKGKGKKKK